MHRGGTYLALGDSITWGAGLDWTIQNVTYASQIKKAMRDNYGRCKILNKAISGWKTADFLSTPYYWSRIEAELITLHIGTNDCSNGVSLSTYQSNLETIIDLLKHNNPNAEIILCSISRRGDSYETSLSSYRNIVQTVATEKNTLLCHFENAWTTSSADTTTYLNSDLLHPTPAGQTALFNVLWPVVQTTNFVKNIAN